MFGSVNSPDVHAVGAGMGLAGDIEPAVPALASPYAASGPRLPGKPGPDCSAVSDRSRAFAGIYRAAARSGVEFAMSGSSAAAPRLSGQLLAHLVIGPGAMADPAGTSGIEPELQERFGPDIPSFLRAVELR